MSSEMRVILCLLWSTFTKLEAYLQSSSSGPRTPLAIPHLILIDNLDISRTRTHWNSWIPRNSTAIRMTKIIYRVASLCRTTCQRPKDQTRICSAIMCLAKYLGQSWLPSRTQKASRKWRSHRTCISLKMCQPQIECQIAWKNSTIHTIRCLSPTPAYTTKFRGQSKLRNLGI